MINCDSAKEIGENLLLKCIGNDFQDLRLKRNDKVKPLSFMFKNLKVYDQEAQINPTQLFNRILCTFKSEDTLKKCFEFELAPFPLSIMDNGILRKTNKSALLAYLDKKCPAIDVPPPQSIFVIDEGHLLHKRVWQFPASYGEILSQYVNYVTYHYGSN